MMFYSKGKKASILQIGTLVQAGAELAIQPTENALTVSFEVLRLVFKGWPTR